MGTRWVRAASTGFPVLVAIAAIVAAGALSTIALAEAAGNDRFELGDGASPPSAGSADLLGAVDLAGPDWGDVFGPARAMRDAFDEYGDPGTNQVPDILDTWGKFRVRRDAAFILDDVSAGAGTDPTTLGPDGALIPGIVASVDDLGNAYAFATFDRDLDMVLYAGVERLATGASTIRWEFNQHAARIDDGGIRSEKTPGDIRISATFDAGLTGVEFSRWGTDGATGALTWIPMTQLSGEGCDTALMACAVSNAVPVPTGGWPAFDGLGQGITELAPGTFLEVAVDLGAFLGPDTKELRFASVQVSTPEDYGVAAFSRPGR